MAPTRPHARAYAREHGEHGFTVLELVIAMVLLAVVLGLASAAFMGGLGGSASTGLSERATTQFRQMTSMLEQDTRAARAPGRDVDVLRDRDAFAAQIRTGRSTLPRSLDVMDVRVATPTQLQLIGDVISIPGNATWGGAECVTWQLVTGASWSVRRTVSPDEAGCSAAGALTSTWIQSTQVATGAVPTRLFSYVLGCDAAACAGGGGCQGSRPVGSATGVARGWVTQVRIDLDALVKSGKATAREQLTTDVTLRNRMSDDYQYALGCVGVER